MPLEFHSTTDLSPPLLREITEFLDSQNTSHPFQYPQWNVSCARFALWREGGSIRWFSTFGVHSPLGLALPQVRAVIANRGPVCDDAKLWWAVTEEFAEQMSRENFTYLDAAPDWLRTPEEIFENGFFNSAWERLSGERATLRLDLEKSADEIFANLRKNTRYEVRRAERLGVSVTPASSHDEVEQFLALHSRLAIRKSFRADAPDDLRAIIQWWISEPTRGTLLLARVGDLIHGGVAIARSGNRCWYLWGAVGDHDLLNVGHILQWNALLWAKSHACSQYDFGGYTPGATSGPAWFKAGFGGTMARFVPPHRRVFRRRYYRMFKLAFRMRALTRKPLALLSVRAPLFPKEYRPTRRRSEIDPPIG